MSSHQRYLQIGAWLAAALLGSTLSNAFGAAPIAPQSASPPHVQARPLRADQTPPLPATRDHLYRDYDSHVLDTRAPLTATRTAAKQAAACDPAVFAQNSGAALVAALRSSETGCINTLFGLAGNAAAQTFAEAKVVAVANAIASDAASYPGDNRNGMLQLILFLRAGLYVQYYNKDVVGSYGSAWRNAIRPALAAFVASPRFADVNDAHGEVLAEFVILIDSAVENARHLDTVRAMLDRYGPDHAAYPSMLSAVNGVFTVLFRGHYDDDFRAAVQGDGGAVTGTVAAFIARNRNADVDTAREYLLRNAGGELARFLQYPEALAATVRPRVKAVLDQFGLVGPGAGIYVRVAEVTDYFDHAHCAYYGLCTFPEDLEASVLPPANARTCSASLRVRSQALTAAQLEEVCAIVEGEEGYFHAAAQTGGTPVADDYNATLEMVIFHSSDDYETYSGVLFGNSTNNGGIYLEGDPADPENQARFLAFEAEWLRPGFEVWNLTHEYIHYLDGRFNWYGPFGAMPLDAPYSAVWYIEGVAEYLSYGYRELVYARAVTEAANPDRFSLSQLFDNEYGPDSVRTYQWGYLATRFMFERHRDRIATLYAVSRPGDFEPGYEDWLDQNRAVCGAEFREWVECFGRNGGDTSTCQLGGDGMFGDGFEEWARGL